MPDRIEARVATILNARELVINRGELAGVEVGMRFAVLADEGFDVVDPETGDSLGDVERPKTLVKITQVREKLAVAATYRTKSVGGSVFGSVVGMAGMFDPPRTLTETLRAEGYEPLPSEEEIVVKVNDRVVQVVGDEFAGWDW